MAVLFEIHDILLHRLWKWRKAKFDAFIKTRFTSDCTASQRGFYADLKADIANYKRLLFWERITRRWYFNHYPKLHFVFPN